MEPITLRTILSVLLTGIAAATIASTLIIPFARSTPPTPHATAPPEEQDENDAENDAENDGEKYIIGMKCERMNLYQKWDMHARFTWTEKYPSDIEEAAENEETVKYAVLVRNSTF